MKYIKKVFILAIFLCIVPFVVKAGTIRFNDPVMTSKTSYKFTISVEDMNLNYMMGKFAITNGTITKITMSSGWLNRTGTNNTFYFYRNSLSSGNYTVATVEVTITGNSRYDIQNFNYGENRCKKDIYGIYFGENASVVDKGLFDSTCGVSNDATLKSLGVSHGTLSPVFRPELELYGVSVPYEVSVLTFYPTVNSSKSKVISGSTCSLKVGLNVCKLVVQAERGNTKTYQITVTRKNTNNTSLSNDASIRNLEVHNATLLGSFQPSVKNYQVKVDKNTESFYFTFVTNSNNDKHTSQPCRVSTGTSSCSLVVTAEDGVTTNTYTFTIVRDEEESVNPPVNNENSSTGGENSSNTGNSGDSWNNGSNSSTPSSPSTDNSNINEIQKKNLVYLMIHLVIVQKKIFLKILIGKNKKFSYLF